MIHNMLRPFIIKVSVLGAVHFPLYGCFVLCTKSNYTISCMCCIFPWTHRRGILLAV